jgi:hypothetical protein
METAWSVVSGVLHWWSVYTGRAVCGTGYGWLLPVINRENSGNAETKAAGENSPAAFISVSIAV